MEEGKKRDSIKSLLIPIRSIINDFAIPFTNNLPEQSIRMIKVKQKVSGCFRTKKGAHTFVTIMSYLGSASKHGIDAYSAIKSALANQSQTLLFNQSTE